MKKRSSLRKSVLPVMAAMFLLVVAPSWADGGGDSQVSFYVEPILQKGLGGTSYDLSVSGGASRLEFPQLSLEAGVLAGISSSRGGQRQWFVEAQVAHSTIALPGSMNDYDWWVFAGYPNVPFSYTYSADSTVSWHAQAEAAWTIATAGPFSLAIYGMYRYQSLSHVEDSVTGWQYVLDTTTDEYVPTPINITTSDVLEYTLTSHTIGIGLLADLQPVPGFTLELRAAYTPVYMSDSDDHKLRTKLSTASGWGNGLYADLRAVCELSRGSGFTPYVGLDGELVYYVVYTAQTQYWYGSADSPTPQGYLLTGIGHVVTSAQFQVCLRFGFKF
jgi:hypothetical protein